MDGSRFDQLARAMAGRRTRRGFLGGLAALAAGAAGLRATEAKCPPGAVAASGGRCICKATGREPGPTGCPCPTGQTSCDGGATCKDLNSDLANCGTCGNACAAGQVCLAGVCRCTPGTCPNGCCDTAGLCRTSTNGTCGLGGAACDVCVASTGEACVNGACACDQAACAAIGGCCAGGTCRASGNATCGTTGGACIDCSASGQYCFEGACVTPGQCPPPCPSCQMCDQSGQCLPDPTRDDANCCPPGGGACNLDGSHICRNGACIPNCPRCQTWNGSICAADSTKNGITCCPGPVCNIDEYSCCNGTCVANNDVNNCGCQGPCPGPFDHATVTCRSGGCFFQCDAGYEDCDEDLVCKEVLPSDQSCGTDICNLAPCPDGTTCIRCGTLGAGICCPSGYHCGIGSDGQCGACVPASDPVFCQRDITTAGRFIR